MRKSFHCLKLDYSAFNTRIIKSRPTSMLGGCTSYNSTVRTSLFLNIFASSMRHTAIDDWRPA